MEELLKNFHGQDYSEGPWDSREYSCCRLCKTMNTKDRRGHWAFGLCRSCYKRLSAQHRKYNDKWAKSHKSSTTSRSPVKTKEYKQLDPSSVKFEDKDINSLLERYKFKCAYCAIDLQIYDQKALNFLQVEYLHKEGTLYELVPVCKSCNCSKKNLIDPDDLRQWAISRGIDYPFTYIKP